MTETIDLRSSDAITRVLFNEGVDTVFGIGSGYLSVLLDSFRRGGLRCITNHHEGAAAFSAAGYVLGGGPLGVVYGQSGPGITNTLTGVAAAFADSVPMLVVASQVPTGQYGRDGHQESTGASQGVDQLSIFNTCSTVRFRPPSASQAVSLTRTAISAAITRRSVGVVDYPADVFNPSVEFEDLEPTQYRATSAPIDCEGLEKVAGMLKQSHRPALVIGRKCSHRGMGPAIRRLAESMDIPVATADQAKGIVPEDHPLLLGNLGFAGHESVAEYLRQCDLVLVLGARLTVATTRYFDRTMFHNLIQIDESAEDIGRNFPVRLAVISDLRRAVEDLAERCADAKIERSSADTVAALRAEYEIYQVGDDRPPMSTPRVLKTLRAILPRSMRVVGDCGLTLQYVKHFFPIYSEDGFYCLYSCAAMGAAIPISIGLQLAQPESNVACIIGDGGALVYLSELAVAARYELPILFIVIDNGGYKQVGDRMERYLGKHSACALPPVDFSAVARGCGCDAETVVNQEELHATAQKAAESRRPTLLHIKVAGDNLFDVTLSSVRESWDRVFPPELDGWVLGER